MTTANRNAKEDMENLKENAYCHEEGCRRKYPYLKRHGYIEIDKDIYCIEHGKENWGVEDYGTSSNY